MQIQTATMKTFYWFCYTWVGPSSPQTVRVLETTGRIKSKFNRKYDDTYIKFGIMATGGCKCFESLVVHQKKNNSYLVLVVNKIQPGYASCLLDQHFIRCACTDDGDSVLSSVATPAEETSSFCWRGANVEQKHSDRTVRIPMNIYFTFKVLKYAIRVCPRSLFWRSVFLFLLNLSNISVSVCDGPECGQ